MAQVRDEVSDEHHLASKDLIPFFCIEIEGVPLVPSIGSGAFVMVVIWFLSRINFALPMTLSHWPSKEEKAFDDKSTTIGLVPLVPESAKVNGPLLMEVILLDEKFITKEGHSKQLNFMLVKSNTVASKVVKMLVSKMIVTPIFPKILLYTLFEIDVI